jgi:hypothetical protein
MKPQGPVGFERLCELWCPCGHLCNIWKDISSREGCVFNAGTDGGTRSAECPFPVEIILSRLVNPMEYKP